MPDVTTINKYPKSTYQKAQVDHIRDAQLAAGAKSCTESEDATNYILTTVWPGASLLSALKNPTSTAMPSSGTIATVETHAKEKLIAALEKLHPSGD